MAAENEDMWKSETKQTRRILIYSGVYQLIFGLLAYFLPTWILNAMDGMELFYPYLSLPDIPKLKILGLVVMILVLLQLLLAIFYPLLDGMLPGRIFGYVFGIFMLLFLPSGTFFGLIFLKHVKTPKGGGPAVTEKDRPGLLATSISQYLVVGGLLMLSMPVTLLLLQFILITLPIDMLFPLFPADFTGNWEVVSWVILIFMAIQIIAGALFPKFAGHRWMRGVAIGFGLFQITSLGIFFWFFLSNLGVQIDADPLTQVVLNFGGIVGILLNPIGVYFGVKVLRGLKLYYQATEPRNPSE